MLLKDGLEPLGELVRYGCLPWPIYDIYRLSELPEPAPMTLWKPGFDEWERKVMLATLDHIEPDLVPERRLAVAGVAGDDAERPRLAPQNGTS